MAKIYNRLQIDVNTRPTAVITAVQKDAASRYLDVVLLDGSIPIDLTGHEVRMYGKKGDGKEFYNDGVITSPTAGRCQFELTDQALAVAQDVQTQIILFRDNEEVLSTQILTIHVVKSLLSHGAVESSNEYGALVVLYQNLYEAYDLMTTMVQQIGVPAEIAQGLSIETMWGAWEFMCDYLKVDLTNLLQSALDNNSVDGVVRRLGETGDKTTDTLMGKCNGILDIVNHETDDLGLVLGAKIICKGILNTKFTIMNNDKIRSDVVITLTESDASYATDFYVRAVPVPLGAHTVVIEVDGEKYTSAISVTTMGAGYVAKYSHYLILNTITQSKTVQLPSNVERLCFTAIGGGGGGGNSGYQCGGGGGGSGDYAIRKALTVVPNETISITIGGGGSGGYRTSSGVAGAAGTATVIGTKLTLAGGGGGATGATGQNNGGLGGSSSKNAGGKGGGFYSSGTGVAGEPGMGELGGRGGSGGGSVESVGGGGGGGCGIMGDGSFGYGGNGGWSGRGGSAGSDGGGYGSGGGSGGGVGRDATGHYSGPYNAGGNGTGGLVLIQRGFDING